MANITFMGKLEVHHEVLEEKMGKKFLQGFMVEEIEAPEMSYD